MQRYALIEAMRPDQWPKNLVVGVPLLFHPQRADPRLWASVIVAICCFCFVTSGMYLVNDVCDRQTDREHPIKRYRAIASGRLSPGHALMAGAALLMLSLVTAGLVGKGLVVLILGYAALAVNYSLWLKHLVVLDVVAIALCFVLRIVGGDVALGSGPSSRMVLCVAIALAFLGFSKRRAELARVAGAARSTRRVLKWYTPRVLDAVVTVSAAMTVGCYALCLARPPSPLLATVPFVTFGVFRYVYLVYQRTLGEDPVRAISRDPPLVATITLWLAASLLLAR